MENNERDNLVLIANMMTVARRDFTDKSYIYLLWGWAVCICALTEYILLKMGKEYHPMVWLALPFVTIIQLIISRRKERSDRITTHMDRVMSYVWTAVMVSMVIILVSQGVMQLSCYPALIILYGIGTYISGSIMNLTIMRIGAACCWVIALVAFYVSFEYQLLLLSLSLILSYIIPGHLLKLRFKNNV